jgi:hypothetical protein
MATVESASIRHRIMARIRFMFLILLFIIYGSCIPKETVYSLGIASQYTTLSFAPKIWRKRNEARSDEF